MSAVLQACPRVRQFVLLASSEGHNALRLFNSYIMAGKNPEVHESAAVFCHVPVLVVCWGYEVVECDWTVDRDFEKMREE